MTHSHPALPDRSTACLLLVPSLKINRRKRERQLATSSSTADKALTVAVSSLQGLHPWTLAGGTQGLASVGTSAAGRGRGGSVHTDSPVEQHQADSSSHPSAHWASRAGQLSRPRPYSALWTGMVLAEQRCLFIRAFLYSTGFHNQTGQLLRPAA